MSAVSNPPARTVWKGRSQWSVSRAICAGISGRIRAKAGAGAGGRAHLGPPLVRALADGLGVRVRVRVVVRADVRPAAGVLLAHAGRDGVFRHRVPVGLGCCRCVPVELCRSHDVLWAGRVWVGFDEYGFRVSTRAMTRTPRWDGMAEGGSGREEDGRRTRAKNPRTGAFMWGSCCDRGQPTRWGTAHLHPPPGRSCIQHSGTRPAASRAPQSCPHQLSIVIAPHVYFAAFAQFNSSTSKSVHDGAGHAKVEARTTHATCIYDRATPAFLSATLIGAREPTRILDRSKQAQALAAGSRLTAFFHPMPPRRPNPNSGVAAPREARARKPAPAEDASGAGDTPAKKTRAKRKRAARAEEGEDASDTAPESDALDESAEDAPKAKKPRAKRRASKSKRKPAADDSDASAALDSDALDDDDDAAAAPRKPAVRRRKKARADADADAFESELELADGQEVVGRVVQAPTAGRVPPGRLSRNTLDFLAKLADPACNNREWFKLHGACARRFPAPLELTHACADPVFRLAEREFKAFIDALTDVLVGADAQLPPLPPKDVIHRIYRDVRFSNDKTPYKRSFSASFSRSGRKGIFAGCAWRRVACRGTR
jgi:hypothetical protein